ncbi:uncharacterized protein N7498_005964 [Penicillium cinerascens]|uniref:F-box domain-containing protein n=1 Tax=Penicillium cinerascens TaxID=70096 RepID=A0A9W9T144_9EURO|nr:uncharacterized protein N7498_005964 [Penicillium cinerascens]KAJ5205085.1 hypothetical protein N7498_005964 [Penicillium cinerascens]
MIATLPSRDPLAILPPEIVLQILDFAPISALASLTSVSRAWHQFIDVTHQEAIYSSETKTTQPSRGAGDLSAVPDPLSFCKLFENTTSWKDLCKRQTLLAHNWAKQRPVTRESVLQVGNDPVWRFRADFKRRFFISTSHAGGLNVTDMDTGHILWRLPSTLVREEDAVRPYAHLEYQDGMAVFDREGDAVEVWQAGLEDTARGEFRRIAILNHDCQTRGFQLSYWTLCVVSNEGQGFVYDMAERPPRLTTHITIEHGAVGHLDQSEHVVIYSLGVHGYHIHDKKSGELLGVLHPSRASEKYHIRPPATPSLSASAALAGTARHGLTRQYLPFEAPRTNCLTPIELANGPLPLPSEPDHVYHREDEWGAGMLHGDLFVGFSRAGRVLVCSNWRKALQDQASFAKNSALLECESDGSGFDLGGWLSVRNHRVMFEIQDQIYVIALDDHDKIQNVDQPTRASYSLLTSSAPQLAMPVSFMALYDDAIMTTYTTLGRRQPLGNVPGRAPLPQHENLGRIFPTKAIRIVTLAPDLSKGRCFIASETDTPEESTRTTSNQSGPLVEEIWHSQAGLLQLVSMLGDEFGGEDDDDDHEVGVFAANFHDDDIDNEWEDVDQNDTA